MSNTTLNGFNNLARTEPKVKIDVESLAFHMLVTDTCDFLADQERRQFRDRAMYAIYGR